MASHPNQCLKITGYLFAWYHKELKLHCHTYVKHIVFPGRLQLLCKHRQVAAAHSTKDFLIVFCLQCSTANGLLYFNLLKECTQSHNSSWEISDRKSSFSSATGPNPSLPVIYKKIWRCFSLFPAFALHLKLGSSTHSKRSRLSKDAHNLNREDGQNIWEDIYF